MKQATVYAVMVWTALMTATMRADYPAIPICTASGAQTAPMIDGEWIVWEDARNGTSNYDIFGYILSEPNEVPICTLSLNQRYPKISGNVVVWQDHRSGQTDIRAFDLEDREPLDLPGMPLDDNIIQRHPKISGSLILYEEEITSGVYNLFVYDKDKQTLSQVSPASVNQLVSAIDGTIVVWVENHGGTNRVYWRDVSKPGDVAARVSQSANPQIFPAVSGDLIVWAEDAGAGDGWDIYACNIALGGQPWVVAGGPGEQNRPAISGSLLAYQHRLGSSGNYAIYAVDLVSGATYAIATNSLHNHQFPSVSGRRVVWQRNTGSSADIYMVELPTPTLLAMDAPAAGEMFLAADEMDIMWSLVDGDTPETVRIDFSADNGLNWQTVAAGVPFIGGYYYWEPIADVDSQACRVRISDTAAGSSASAMSGVFTVFQCKAALTADLTGNCRVDMADFAEFARQWLTSGNPYDETWGWD